MIQLLIKLIPYVRPHLGKVVGSLLFSFLLAGIKGYQAYLVKPIFDKGLAASSTFDEALVLCGVLLALSVINFPARFLHFYWIRYVVDRATCTIRTELYTKLQNLPMAFYTKSKQGALLSQLLNDTNIFSQGFRNSIDLIREPITAAVMLGIALFRDWQLTLVVFAVTPLFIIIFGKSGKLVRANQTTVQEELSEITHTMNEGIAAQKMSKAFNLRNYMIKRFEKIQERYFSAQMRTTIVEEIAHPLVEFVGAIAFIGVILFAHHRISSGAMSTGDFISFVTALALLMDPIRKYSQANVKLNQARAAGDRLFALLETPEEIDQGKVHHFEFKDSIVVKDVTFSYGEGDVVKNLNLVIKKGERVALVGPSGSGKSTLINLLLGLYPVTAGEILIDGIPIQNISLERLRTLFGLVSQDIFLLHDTIEENLKLGLNYNVDQMKMALTRAFALGYISELPLREQTLIGDRGARLSGGQQQRLTIARAFLRDPSIYLFDEATSALDNESEKAVQKAMEAVSSDKTVIAVAHRLSTISDFDRIYVLKEGRVIEEGRHQDLMNMNGAYRKIYELGQKV